MKYIKVISYFLLALIIYLVLITSLSYFNLISYKVLSVISFIIIILLFVFSGFYLARKTESKGYKTGLAIGFINLILLFLLSLILRAQISSTFLMYSTILLLSSTIGGMFGINFNNNLLEEEKKS